MEEVHKLSESNVEKYLNCSRCSVFDKKRKIKLSALPFT